MKILHIYKSYYPDTYGGVEKMIEQLSIAGTLYGLQSSVLCLTPENKFSINVINGCEVHRLPQLFNFISTPFSCKIFNYFKTLAQQVDIIHYHFPWPVADLLHFTTKINKPSLITYHADISHTKLLLPMYKPLMNAFLASQNNIVATSQTYANTSPVLMRFTDKLSIIPIGLNPSSYPAPSEDRLHFWRKQFNCKFFLFIGVIRYYKGVDILIEAAKTLNAHVVIIGEGPVLDEHQHPNVSFIHKVSEADKIALLTLCYCVVLPSHLRQEAFGIALLEGAMFAKPLISCDINTGTSFINLHQETGLVVPPHDPIALKHAMQYLLENPEMALEMGNRAKERFESYFTAQKMAKDYVDIYHNICHDTAF